jgi:hypothetical protein
MAKKKKSDKITIGEAIRIIIVTVTALAIPTTIVAYPLHRFAHLNIFLCIVAGLLVTFGIVYGFGLHKPVYENQNKSKNVIK